MWSGGPQWTQWALNPSAYQNVSHEQIDWAALAQQWIKMKESHSVPPPVHLQAPPPPPPPPLPPPQQRHQEEVKEKEIVTREAEEGGEAPMEMDAKEEEEELPSSTALTSSTSVNPPVTSAPPPDASSSSWGTWNNWQQPQHWGGPGWHGPGVGTSGTWAGPPSHPPPNHPHAHIAPPAGGTKDPPGSSVGVPPPSHQMGAHFPFPPQNATGPMFGDHNHPPSFDYNHGAEGVEHFGQVGFWGAGESGADMGPSPFIRHNRHGDWRGNRGPPGMPGRPYHDHQGRHGPSEHSDEEEDQSGGTVLDAAKRRQLPAWIREGLEKMEREKMKQLERERLMKEREAVAKKLKDQEQLAVRELSEKDDGVVESNMASIPKRSKFESDSEEDDDGNNEETSDRSMEWRAGVGPLKRRKKSRFQDASSPGSASPHDVSSNMKPAIGHPNGRRKMADIVDDDEGDRGRSPPPTPLSREELMQETMLKVRRLLTEVLLEVTNEEMLLVAKEVLSKAKSKAPALQLRKTPALATLTGQLGLGMYGDSESSEEDSDYGDNAKGDRYGRRRNVDPESDSDEELKDQIRRRKQEFVQTEREIEAQLQEEEEREREKEHEREREKRLMGEDVPGVGDDDGEGDVETKESTGEEEERQVENETDTKHPSLQQEGLDTQKPKFSRLPDDKEAEECVGEVKEEKQAKDNEVRVGDTKSKPALAASEKPNAMSHASKKHERKKKESKRKKKHKGTSSQSESHTSSHSSSSTSSSDSSSSSSSSESTSSSRSSSPSSSSESSDSRHQSRKRSKPNKEMLRKDGKSRRGGVGSRDSKNMRRRSRSRERSRSRGRGRGEGGRKQREGGGGSNRRDDDGGRRRSRGRRGGSRSPERKDRRRGGGNEKDGSSGGGRRRRDGRRSVTPRKGHRSRSRSDRRRHSGGGGRRSSSRSSSYAELSKKQGHGHRD